MQKSDKEYNLLQIQNKVTEATSNTRAVQNYYDDKFAELNEDSPTYKKDFAELDDEYDTTMAEIATWEEDLEKQQDNCEVEIELLEGNIKTWTSSLQSNVQSSHKYGPQ